MKNLKPTNKEALAAMDLSQLRDDSFAKMLSKLKKTLPDKKITLELYAALHFAHDLGFNEAVCCIRVDDKVITQVEE
jgi:hypothetical protein